MNTLMKKIGLGIALGATAMTVAAVPAEAQRYRGGYHGYYRGGGGGALVAGIAGLAVGAAIASDRGPYRGGYYDRGPGYRGYYDGYYRDGYYPRGGCFIERRWDRYYDRPVNVRVCR